MFHQLYLLPVLSIIRSIVGSFPIIALHNCTYGSRLNFNIDCSIRFISFVLPNRTENL